MTLRRDAFERTRARLRDIWNASEWNQAAWHEACRDLWIILEAEPDRLDQMIEFCGPPEKQTEALLR